MDFANKAILVTGASAGIGETTALLFASLGASLALVGRNAQNLSAVGERCKQLRGKEPLLIVADLATDEGVERTVKTTLDHFKRLDVLINNVGAQTDTERADMEAFVRPVYNLMRLLEPALTETKGNIVNVSNFAGSTITVSCLLCAMGQEARDHYTQLQLAKFMLAPTVVRVDTVSPGLTVSKFIQSLTGYTDEEYVAWIKEYENNNPMARMCYDDVVAKTIAHLTIEEQ